MDGHDRVQTEHGSCDPPERNLLEVVASVESRVTSALGWVQ